MNMSKLKPARTKILAAVLALICLFPAGVHASPWAHKEGYWAKTGGKFMFGVKHTLFSWLVPYMETYEPQYAEQWDGFCAGMGKSVVYMATGMIQLITFPIPVDFPDIGLGLHVVDPAKCPGIHDLNAKPAAVAPAATAVPAVSASAEAAATPPASAATSLPVPEVPPLPTAPKTEEPAKPAVAVQTPEPAAVPIAHPSAPAAAAAELGAATGPSPDTDEVPEPESAPAPIQKTAQPAPSEPALEPGS